MRLTYIDYIKAFAISLVIILHSQYFPFESLFFKSMYSMCVPLFFMVNGYLMLRKEHSISDMLRKNAKLLVVLFCWALLATSETMIWKGDWANGLVGGQDLIRQHYAYLHELLWTFVVLADIVLFEYTQSDIILFYPL